MIDDDDNDDGDGCEDNPNADYILKIDETKKMSERLWLLPPVGNLTLMYSNSTYKPQEPQTNHNTQPELLS